MMEENLRRALLLSRGDWSVFVTRPLSAGLLAAALLLLIIVLIRRSSETRPPRRAWVRTGPKLAAQLALACLTWLVLTPLVLALFALATIVFSSLGIESDAHPLTLFRREGSPVRAGLFLVSVTVLTPLAEELIFRGTMLVWAAKDRLRSQILIVVAGLFAAGTAKPGSVLWPVWFWCLGVAFHTFVLWRCRDLPGARARLAAITSSSLVFAAAHSAVWPTPIPLFVLGLGLGWLTLRTGSILAPTVVHGAFNLVSVIVVLRGGAG
jgi:membrane protease YdiL (CAAX protease family)